MSVYNILIKILGQDAGASAALQKASKEATGLQGAVKGMGGALDILAVGGFAFVGKQALQMAWDLGELGAQSLTLKASFQDLAAQAGGSADAMLEAIRRGAGGTVSEMDMIAAANRGIMLGLGANADQWEQLAEVARYRAKAMGISMTQALGDISLGIGRESRLILDNLGIILDVDGVTQSYARTLGKTADQLSATERKQAILTAVIEDGQSKIAAAGGIQEDYTSSIQQMDAALADAKTTLAEAFAPAVASVATAVSEAVPKLMATTSQLKILASAGVEWAQAALSGEDASAAFNASVAEGIGATSEAAQIRMQAAQEQYAAAMEIVRSLEAEIAAQKAMLASQEEGTMGYDLTVMAIQQYESELAQAQSVADGWLAKLTVTNVATSQLTTVVSALVGETVEYRAALEASAGANDALAMSVVNAGDALNQSQVWFAAAADAANQWAIETGAAMRAVMADASKVDIDEVASGFNAAIGRLKSSLAGLATLAPGSELTAIYDQYQRQLQDLYANANNMTEFELARREAIITANLDATVESFRKGAEGERSAISTMQSNYQSLRSAVESALQATAVTQEDMDLSALGQYVDKWDEDARRLDAIAQRGFAELQAHADWAAVLNIPPEVLAGNEAALKAWAKSAADQVRNLARPDLLADDIGKMADLVQAQIQEKAAKEVTIDLVIKELQARGVSDEAARQQVLQMYGLEEPLPVSLQLSEENRAAFMETVGTVAVPVTLTTGETVAGAAAGGEQLADLSTSAAPIVSSLMVGINDALSQQNIVLAFTQRLQEDTKANAKPLYDAGILVWAAAEDGILAGIKQGRYAEEFAFWLVPIIIQKIKEWQQWEGNTE